MLPLFFYFPLLPPGRAFSGLLSAIVPPDKEQRTGLGRPENDDFPIVPQPSASHWNQEHCCNAGITSNADIKSRG